MSIQLKRGLSSARKNSEIVLEDGQPFFEKDTDKLYVGDGSTQLKNLKAITTANLDSGTGKYALQQTVSANTFSFAENNNAKAVELDASLKGTITNGGTGEYSTSLGGKAAAMGRKSFASGTNVIAKGQYSFVNGDNTVALGQSSHAEGSKTTASGIASHSEGTESWASNLGSHAEGNKTEATGEFSHAEGNQSKSVGDVSHAEGFNTTAAGNSSHTEGNGSQTKGEKYIRPSSGGSTGGGGEGTGGGTTEPIQPDDDMSTFFGVGAHAEGAETIASGYTAHAEGYKTYASGHMSHAEGSVTDALGDYSHVEGVGSKAKGNISHAEGGGTIAEGKWSHAEGAGTLAKGDGSHAEGTSCQALGNYSHAGGMSSIAKGDVAFTHGLGLVANAGQSVFGNYNVEDTDSIFIVGAGTQSLKQTAFKVANSGQVLFEQSPTHALAPIRLKDFTDDFFVNSKAELAKRAIQANDFADNGTIKSEFSSHLTRIQSLESQANSTTITLQNQSTLISKTQCNTLELPVVAPVFANMIIQFTYNGYTHDFERATLSIDSSPVGYMDLPSSYQTSTAPNLCPEGIFSLYNNAFNVTVNDFKYTIKSISVNSSNRVILTFDVAYVGTLPTWCTQQNLYNLKLFKNQQYSPAGTFLYFGTTKNGVSIENSVKSYLNTTWTLNAAQSSNTNPTSSSGVCKILMSGMPQKFSLYIQSANWYNSNFNITI